MTATIADFDYTLVLDDGGCAEAAGVDEVDDCSLAFWAFCRLVAGGGFVASIIVRMRRWADCQKGRKNRVKQVRSS